MRLGDDESSRDNCEGSLTRLIISLIRDTDFLHIGRGVLLGDGLTVAFVEELSEVDLLRSCLILVTVDRFEKSSCLPSAPTTAETRTAGARAAVPGSCQYLALEKSGCDRLGP